VRQRERKIEEGERRMSKREHKIEEGKSCKGNDKEIKRKEERIGKGERDRERG